MQRCDMSFTIWRDGAPVAFVQGQLVDDKDPILKTHRHLFSEPSPAPAGPFVLRPVEQATAGPGEARTLTPPQKTARQGGDGSKEFDPGEHNAPEVIDYLKAATEEERARVLEAEQAGKAR